MNLLAATLGLVKGNPLLRISIQSIEFGLSKADHCKLRELLGLGEKKKMSEKNRCAIRILMDYREACVNSVEGKNKWREKIV